MSLLHMSFAGAVMILAVTIIRALVIYRVPKKTFLVLWGITLARLLIPFSIPSALSIYTLFVEKEPAITSIGDMSVTTFEPAIQQGQLTTVSSNIPRSDFGISIWASLWAIGALVCAVVFSITYWKCYREFQTSLPADNDFTRNWLSSHPIRRPIQIRQSELVSAPLTFGILRPVILMPKTTDWNDEKTLQYVLAHELVHIRRFDSITKLILLIAFCVHWFNPFVWVMYILANRDIELSCDETVVRQFGEQTRASYARTLIRMEETKSGITPLCNNFSKNALEERMTAIMKTKKITILSIVLAALIVIGTTTVCATSAKVEDSQTDSATISAGIEKTYTENGKTYYVLWDGSIMEESEYLEKYPTPEVEWWTYDEYKEWLENEKQELQSILGTTGSINGEKFTWTQEKIDEAIAMYEEILQEIKDGVKYSKTVSEDGDPMLSEVQEPSTAETTIEMAMDSVEQQEFTPEDILEQYGDYGISLDQDGNMLFQGELVRSFQDGTDEDDGASSVRYQYYNGNGTVDVHTIRSATENDDGSIDSLGEIIKIEKDIK